jgi:hypothetical protein
MTAGRRVSPVLALALALAPAAPAQDEAQSLLTLRGIVVTSNVAQDPEGQEWIDLQIRAEDEPDRTLRLAPAAVMQDLDFRLAPGDLVQARVFAGPAPHLVHRIFNETTGQSLRLRCLHGEPLWGPGAAGPGHGPRRGRGHGPS